MNTLAQLAGVEIEKVPRLGSKRTGALRKGGIETVFDLLMHVPRAYIDRKHAVKIAEAPVGEEVTIIGRVHSVSERRPRKGLLLIEAVISDGVGRLRAVWFNQPYRAGRVEQGAEVMVSGKLETFKGKLQMNTPALERLDAVEDSLAVGRIVPIHPVVGPVTAGWIRRGVYISLRKAQPIPDPVPARIVQRLGLAPRDWAIGAIHFPDRPEDVTRARSRLVFDEFFRLEVALATRKKRMEVESTGIVHRGDSRLRGRFLEGLPYRLTAAQRAVLGEIDRDLARPHAMHRLLQGEVGSGKTVVAVAALLTVIEGGWQGAVMAPTEVLAEQHFLGIVDLLAGAGLGVPERGEGAALGMDSLFSADTSGVTAALLTRSRAAFSSYPGARRSDVIEAIEKGEAQLVVGTHALIQEGIRFRGLGMAVIDEQHRFGVAQRVELRDKAGKNVDPDLLVMTATPIPRTLSMTLYGDLDVSIIDELPPGRTPVLTRAIGKHREDEAWELIRSEAGLGRQAFVVCPLVEDSAKVEAASAVAEFERLQGILGDLRVGLIHGQLPPRDKEAVMAAFRDRELDVLVSTTVIEVGIDVPNATVMVIEDADRFGLSQLHQLRGRVGRGEHGGTCIMIADPTTEEGEDRIAAMVATNDGFELANEDLRIRGQGTVFGHRQSGMTDLRLADLLGDFELLAAARREAFALVEEDPDLDAHPDLATEIRTLLGKHMEWLFQQARA